MWNCLKTWFNRNKLCEQNKLCEHQWIDYQGKPYIVVDIYEYNNKVSILAGKQKYTSNYKSQRIYKRISYEEAKNSPKLNPPEFRLNEYVLYIGESLYGRFPISVMKIIEITNNATTPYIVKCERGIIDVSPYEISKIDL